MIDPVGAAIVGLFGLVVGSFLNVCIHRLPQGGSIVHPPSHCPTCKVPLRWYDNVPVVGYLMLRGRCRSCATPISVMYPAVEAVTGGLFLVQYLLVGLEPLLVARLVFVAAMVVLFMIDLRHRILPNVVTLPGVVLGHRGGSRPPPD